jgi:DNA-binding XRE family transcriptional regulator
MLNGKSLEKVRSALGLSRTDLADRLGVDYATVYSWEHKKAEELLKPYVAYSIQGLFPERVIIRDETLFVSI